MNLGILIAKNNGRVVAADVACDVVRTPNFSLNNPDLGFFIPPVRHIIYHGKDTIVVWKDGTRNIAHCHGLDEFDRREGFKAAVLQKLFRGNKTIDKLIELYRINPKKKGIKK